MPHAHGQTRVGGVGGWGGWGGWVVRVPKRTLESFRCSTVLFSDELLLQADTNFAQSPRFGQRAGIVSRCRAACRHSQPGSPAFFMASASGCAADSRLRAI